MLRHSVISHKNDANRPMYHATGGPLILMVADSRRSWDLLSSGCQTETLVAWSSTVRTSLIVNEIANPPTDIHTNSTRNTRKRVQKNSMSPSPNTYTHTRTWVYTYTKPHTSAAVAIVTNVSLLLSLTTKLFLSLLFDPVRRCTVISFLLGLYWFLIVRALLIIAVVSSRA